MSVIVYGVKIASFLSKFLAAVCVKCDTNCKTMSQTTLMAKKLRAMIVKDEFGVPFPVDAVFAIVHLLLRLRRRYV